MSPVGSRAERDGRKREMRKHTSRLCVVMTLILLIGIFTMTSCRKEIELIYVGADRVIGKLDNGNWEVTEELVILYRKYKKFYEDNKGGK